MQTLGTEWGRECIAPDVWTRLTLAGASLREGRSVVIDDVRFPNEVVAIRALGGIVVRIERPGLVPEDHPSGTAQAAIVADHTLANDGIVGDLLTVANITIGQGSTAA